MGIYKLNHRLVGINGLIGSGKDTVTGMIQNHSLLHDNRVKNVKFANKLKQICGAILGVDPIMFEDQDFKKQKLPPIWEFFKIEMDTVVMEPIKISNNKVMAKKTMTKTLTFDRMPNGAAIRTPEDLEQMKDYLIKNYPALVEIRGIPVSYTYREMLQYIGTDLLRNQFHPDVHVMATFSDYVPVADSWDDNGLTLTKNLPFWVISDTRFQNEAQYIRDRGGLVIRVERYELDSTFKCKTRHQDKVFKTQYFDNCGVVGTDQNGIEEFFDYPDIYRFNPGAHSSETELNNFDFDLIIYNSSDLKYLEKKVDSFVRTKMFENITPKAQSNLVNNASK